jgi:hypothetical protein
VAQRLGMPHVPDGIVVTGTPIGCEAFIRAHADAWEDSACTMFDTLMDLPLQRQERLLLMHMSLQKKLAHMPRTAWWPAINDAILCLEGRVWEVSACKAPVSGARQLRTWSEQWWSRRR